MSDRPQLGNQTSRFSTTESTPTVAPPGCHSPWRSAITITSERWLRETTFTTTPGAFLLLEMGRTAALLTWEPERLAVLAAITFGASRRRPTNFMLPSFSLMQPTG